MSDVQRFPAPGPWITRDLKPCVLAADYDALAAELAATKEAWAVQAADDKQRIATLEAALREIGLEVSSNGCDGTGDEVCVYTESPIEDWCPMCRVGASIRAARAPKEPT